MKRYSISEIAKILNKSRQWVWVLVISGKLKAEKVGNSYIINQSSLKQYQNRNGGTK